MSNLPPDELVEDWRSPMRHVIIRAICDALGFTNITPTKRAHAEAVKDAQAWFIEEDESGQFEAVCDIAGLDSAKVRRAAKELISARWSGDHSRIPEFWRPIFAEGRLSLTGIERALDGMSPES